MKYTFKINKPQNAYAGWTGVIVDENGKRHAVKMDCGAAFNTRAALVRAAQSKALAIRRANQEVERIKAQWAA